MKFVKYIFTAAAVTLIMASCASISENPISTQVPAEIFRLEELYNRETMQFRGKYEYGAYWKDICDDYGIEYEEHEAGGYSIGSDGLYHSQNFPAGNFTILGKNATPSYVFESDTLVLTRFWFDVNSMENPLEFVETLSEELNKLYGDFEHEVNGSLEELNEFGEISYSEVWHSESETNSLSLATIEDESSGQLYIALTIYVSPY